MLIALFYGLYLDSLTHLYKTGTTSIVRISIVIPPKTGIAIGTIISEPLPVDVKTGIRANIVVTFVIRHGLNLRVPASMTFLRISAILCELAPLKVCLDMYTSKLRYQRRFRTGLKN